MVVMIYLLVTVCCAGTFAAVAPSRGNVDNTGNSEKGTQLFYIPRDNPQSQKLKVDAESLESNNDVRYFQPNQQRQGAQTFELDGSIKQGTRGKLETLEPDAELLPGAQQPQNPPAQFPVPPAAGIPGLLPGQQFYIVHPQHQIYMNPLYPGIPNGYGQQIPGYQRFYIVQAQPTLGDGTFANPAGYQVPILIDPSSGQQLIQPQYLQPNLQRYVQPQNEAQPQQNQNKEPLQNTQQKQGSLIKNSEPANKFTDSFQNFPGGNRNFVQLTPNYPGVRNGVEHQNAFQFLTNNRGFIPQYQTGSGLQGDPSFQGGSGFQSGPSGYPIFPFVRQSAVPYQGTRDDYQLLTNPLAFTQLSQLPGAFGGTGVGSYPYVQAQGRNDFNVEEAKDDISTESNSYAEATKKSEEKVESTPHEPKVREDSDEIMEAENSTTMRIEEEGVKQL